MEEVRAVEEALGVIRVEVMRTSSDGDAGNE